MKAINLTTEEIEVIHRYQKGEIYVYAPGDEDRKHLSDIIDKAERALPDYPNMVNWIYEKYLDQQANGVNDKKGISEVKA